MARCRLRGRRRCAGGRSDRDLLDRRRSAHTAAVAAAQTLPLSIFRRAPKLESSLHHSSAICCGINLATCRPSMAAEMAADKASAQAQSRHLNRPQDQLHGRHRMSYEAVFRPIHDCRIKMSIKIHELRRLPPICLDRFYSLLGGENSMYESLCCAICREPIPARRALSAKYCGQKCKNKALTLERHSERL